MQHFSTRWHRALTITAGLLLMSASTSYAQCMAGGGGGGTAGAAGLTGGSRMMGGTAAGATTSGSALMSLQQGMQMAQMVQQMRTVQLERQRMIQAQRNQQAAQPRRTRQGTNRQAANPQGTAIGEQRASIDNPLGNNPNLQANAGAPSQTAMRLGRTLRNRRPALNRSN